MKKLFLVAATSYDKLEQAIMRSIALIERNTGKQETMVLEYGRADDSRHLAIRQAKFVVFLGVSALKLNQDLTDNNAIGFVIGDPMNLGCIQGRGVEILDFRPKPNGIAYYLDKHPVKALVKRIIKVYRDETLKPGSVTIESLDYVPTILAAISDNVSFVQELVAVSYSIRNELDKSRFKSAFVQWIAGPHPPEKMREELLEIAGLKRSKRLDALVELFNSQPAIRKALRTMIGAMKEKRPISIDKLAAGCNINASDFRYIQEMIRRNTLVVSMDNSEKIHAARKAGRIEYTTESDETIDDVISQENAE